MSRIRECSCACAACPLAFAVLAALCLSLSPTHDQLFSIVPCIDIFTLSHIAHTFQFSQLHLLRAHEHSIKVARI